MGDTVTAGSPPRAPDPRYRVVAGPEGYLSPAAAAMGIELPDEGYSLVEGESISDSLAPDIIAERLLEDFANIALKIIRSGTDCYTIALCGERGHEDAMVTMRDAGDVKVASITAAVRRLKAGGHDA